MSDTFDFHYTVTDSRMHVWYANQNDVDELLSTLSPRIKEITICGDYVDHVIIPDGIEYVYVLDAGLKTIHVPDSVKTLDVSINLLKTLELPANIEYVRAKYNKIETVTFRGTPAKLHHLQLKSNRVHDLMFDAPDCLEYIRVDRMREYSDSVARALARMQPDDPFIDSDEE